MKNKTKKAVSFLLTLLMLCGAVFTGTPLAALAIDEPLLDQEQVFEYDMPYIGDTVDGTVIDTDNQGFEDESVTNTIKDEPAVAEEVNAVTTQASDEIVGAMAGGYGPDGKFLLPIDPPVAGSIPISSRAELEAIKDNLNGVYHLEQDIDLTGSEWIPIGNNSNSFTGTFDGQGHTIRGMTITGEGYEDNGLFGDCYYASIKNVGMENVNINIVRETLVTAGSVCGLFHIYGGYQNAFIRNCYATGDVNISANTPDRSSSFAGGICGISQAPISGCYNTGTVTAYSLSAFNGHSSSSAAAGGICGRGDAETSTCYNSGNITSSSFQDGGNGNNPIAAGGSHSGGICGTYGFIVNCYNIGNISSSSSVNAYAGGICAVQDSRIINCYNWGNVVATTYGAFNSESYAGGISGYTFWSTYTCYSTGDIFATTQYGGIVGSGNGSTRYDCYCLNLYGSGYYDVQLTDSQMRDQLNFEGWDFDTVWKMPENGGYPILQWQVEDASKSKRIFYNKDFDCGYVDVNWGPELFSQPATASYNPDLALVAAALNATVSSSTYLSSAFNKLGFNKSKYRDVNGHAWAIGHQTMEIDGIDTVVVAIVFRGTDSWSENFGDASANYPGEDFYGYKTYKYFLDYMQLVWDDLNSYADEYGIKSEKVKFLIAGHSLGGAAANLLAAKMMLIQEYGHDEWDEWATPPTEDDLYAFTFGALNAFDHTYLKAGEYSYITNFFNYYDTFGPHGDGAPVPWPSMVLDKIVNKPAYGWESSTYKFGVMKDFKVDFKGIFLKGDNRYKNHVMPCYVYALKANFDPVIAFRLHNFDLFWTASTMYAVKDSVPVRSSPSQSGAIVKYYNQDQSVKALSYTVNNAGNIWFETEDGWVFWENLYNKLGTDRKLYTKGSNIPVRDTPYESGVVVERLPLDNAVNTHFYTVNSQGNIWYKTDTGWIYEGNLTTLPNVGSPYYGLRSECPVDVEVFNASGTLLASIKNNIVETQAAGITIEILGEAKQIFLQDDQRYMVRLTGTDIGIMTYYVERFDADTSEFWEEKIFENVVLTLGKAFLSEIGDGIDAPDVELFVLDAKGDKSAEVQFDGEEVVIEQEVTLTYTISATPLTPFGSLQTPYTQPAAQTVTITNTGTDTITLTQPTSTDFVIGTLSTTNLTANGDTATFTVRPQAGLAVGVYNEKITVSGDNGASATVNAVFTVTANAPTYTATISPTSKTFTGATVGYGAQTAQEFTITNTGTGTVTNIAAAFTKGTAFEINAALSSDFTTSGNAVTISVRPKTGLSAATYTDTLTITGDNGINLSVALSFTVSSGGGGGGGGSGSTTPPSATQTPPAEEGRTTESTGTANSGNDLSINTPPGQASVQNSDGSTTLPGGGTITTPGDGATITAPPGTVINNGKITFPKGSGGGTITDSHGNTYSLPEDAVIILNANTPLGYYISIDNPFTDVTNSDWFYNAVMFAYAHGLMVGTSTEPMQFSPNLTTTRSMIVTILYRLAGSPSVSGLSNPFDDVAAGTWYADAVSWAAANDIVSGVGEGKYDPNAPITRQDLAVIMARFADKMGINLPATQSYAGFNDDAYIADYAREAIKLLFQANILNGYPDGSFIPYGSATRAEVATIIMNYLEANN